MRSPARSTAAFLVIAGLMLACAPRALSYTTAVKPIIDKRCLECHQPGGKGYEKSGLDMRSYESLMKGTKFGPVVLPGDAVSSVLLQLIEHRADQSLNMPHQRAQLPPEEIEVIRSWIEQGAHP